MSTGEPTYGTTGERLKQFALNDETRERLSAWAARYWLLATYAVLGFSAAILRFWNLGERSYHHDESLHGFYSWGFRNLVWEVATFGAWDSGTKLSEYHHVPFMHGPFQFISNGFMMSIFGDGDYQGRMVAAVMGTGMVFLPFLLRRQLGTFGAITASALIAFSPTLIYYSRFTREDIYTGFWTLGIVCFMWRYLRSGENKWLYLTAGFMAGAFATKETTFFTIGAFLLFLNFMFATYLADKIRETRPMSTVQYAGLIVGLNFVAWAIAIAWPFVENWRSKYRLDAMPNEASMLIVMGTLAIPNYAAAVQFLPFFGDEWRNRPYEGSNFHVHPDEANVAYTTIFFLIGISVVIGTLWRTRTWLIAAACFWVPFVLLFTTFFSNPEGFFSGMWGSLDYWMSQQDVARGNQPDYYYFITIPVYEFVPLALSVAALLYYGIKGNLIRAGIVAAAVIAIIFFLALPSGPERMHVSVLHTWIPFAIVLALTFILPMDMFNRFLIFWLVLTSLALTVASEKMPWLNVHIAIALAMLGGRLIGDILERSDLREDLPKLERFAPFAYAAIAAALSIVVFVIVGPFSPASFGGWALAVVAAVAVYWAFSGYSRRTAMQVAIVAAVAAFSVFSLRAGLLAAWGHPDSPWVGEDPNTAQRDHGEVPVEILVYTQSSGDIPTLRDRIDRFARESGQGKQLPIVVDTNDGYTWPWAWYLRDYERVTWSDVPQGFQPPAGAVLLINANHINNVQLGDAYEPRIEYHHRRWFPESYRGKDGMYDTHDFFSDVMPIGGRWDFWIDFWIRKTLPASEPGTTQGAAFFPVGSGVIDPTPAGPTVRVEGNQIIMGAPGVRNGELEEPADVAVDAQGNIYVADQRNNRIQKYDANGVFQVAVGGITGDVTMTQPWSVAVAPDGTVFVADTWDHRVLKLDSSLKQVDAWGEPCTDAEKLKSGSCGDFELYGPRDIHVTSTGNVMITDTGNNRVVEYTADGEFVRTFGGKGKGGGAFEYDEPVSVVTNNAGDIFISDFWNSRIVILDSNLNLKDTIGIDSWGSTAVNERAYVWVLADGRILASDPTTGRVLAFAPDGSPAGTYELPKEANEPVARPIGVTSDGTNLIVVDSAGSVVRKLPLTEIR